MYEVAAGSVEVEDESDPAADVLEEELLPVSLPLLLLVLVVLLPLPLLLLLPLLPPETSWPFPYKTVWPSACSDSVGLVLEPSALAMVNRVVHVGLALFRSVNW